MMIRTGIFQKYFLMATSLILVFIVLGVVFNNYLMELTRPPRREPMPPIFIAKIVDRLNPTDKVKSLEELLSWQNGPMGPKLTLVDQHGTCVYPTKCQLEIEWQTLQLPIKPYDFVKIKNLNDPMKPPRFDFMPMPPPGRAGGPPPPPMMRDMETVVVRLDHPTPLFLLISPGPLPPMPKGGFGGPWIGLASLLISLFLGIGVSIAIIYNSMKKGVMKADQVISEIRGGNLKSRFNVTRTDEFGQAMLRFNTMADEIEKLVHGLKTSEQARTKVLQELAHDLRTPLASLKNLVETLQTRIEKLDTNTRDELLTLSLKEIDYFERLVEDLLFLAQLKEPEYADHKSTFDLPEVVLDVVDDCLYRNSQKGKSLKLVENLSGHHLPFAGDDHPIRRLIRNAVENACSFAQSQVSVNLKNIDNHTLRITIADDGPGFKNEDLHQFGQRSISRKLNTDPNGRVSLGLGSVVIKTICDVYHGSLKVRNLTDPNGTVLGAELQIELPHSGRKI
ncbi:MAG: HAMP domain-containing histidine kinase [Bdellovibrionaceae bacterium]|nr:HAMP domain-containing histidine kinase [Pseudobdellovibrionaceae bacterium]